MKKLFFIAAIAGAALVSCTKNEVAPVAEQQEITFAAPVVGTITKDVTGEIDGNTYPTDEEFNVYAVWHLNAFEGWATNATLYMDQVECTKDGNSWKPTSAEGKYYWPKEGYLTFAAYSPADLTATTIAYGADGLTVTGFRPAALTKDQFDFLYSERTIGQEESTYADGSDNAGEDGLFDDYTGVDIKFQHALSQIEFWFKSDVADVIDLKTVTIKNAQAQGTFKENISGTPTVYEATPAWDFSAYPTEKADYNIYTQTALDHLTTTAVEKKNGVKVDCIILPQSLAGVDVEITYAIKKGDGTYLEQTTTIPLNVQKAGSDVINTWVMGKKYIYTVTITLDEILFDPAVVDWADVTINEIVL